MKTEAELYELQDGRCFYCSKHMRPYPWRNKTPKQLKGYTRDHVNPTVLGGTNYRNIVLACFKCNNDKADRAPTSRELELVKLLHSGIKLHVAIVTLIVDEVCDGPVP